MNREMKDSGIPWIGEIPKKWQVNMLSSLFDEHKQKNKDLAETNLLSLSYGKIVRKDINTKEGLLPESFDGYNVILRGDIVFRLTDLQNDKRSLRTGLCLEKGIITSAYVTIRERTPLNSSYFHYLLHSYDLCKVFYGMGDGVRQGMNYSDLRKLLVLQPSLTEQQKIAEFLDRKCSEIDEMVALQEKYIEELKAYKQSVITEAVTKGLNPDVPMRDSGIEWIGQIPEHWGVCRVKDCLLNTKNNLRVGPFGSALSGNDICDTGEYWIYNQRTVLDGNFSTNNSFVTKEKYKELESFRVFPNDILITTRGSIGKIAIVPSDAPIGILHPCIIRFVIDESRYISRLLKRIFNESDFVLKQLRYQSNSTTIEVIYSYTLRNITLPNIPITEQQAIANYLDEKCADIDSLIQTKQSKIDSLKEYKKSIIYEYVTGKKEVIEHP